MKAEEKCFNDRWQNGGWEGLIQRTRNEGERAEYGGSASSHSIGDAPTREIENEKKTEKRLVMHRYDSEKKKKVMKS